MRKQQEQTPEWMEKWAGKVHGPEDMVRFVDAIGCCTRAPLPRYPGFPSQDAAMGDLEPGVPDPWFWKDDLHAERRIYYTRIFADRPGFISYSILPAFIATNGAVADELIFSGALPQETVEIYEAIRDGGPIAIRDLKRILSDDAKRSADGSLHELDRRFIITKTGITGRTRGTYGYIWDLVERWSPDLLIAADKLGRRRAEELIRDHLSAFGIAPNSPFYTKVLGWTDE